MDKKLLVESGHKLIHALEEKGEKARAAMWVHNSDTDVWRLWIVPSKGLSDKREFYRLVSETLSENESIADNLDASDTEFMKDSHPAIAALKGMFKVRSQGTIELSNTMLNGFFLPDGLILQMDL